MRAAGLLSLSFVLVLLGCGGGSASTGGVPIPDAPACSPADSGGSATVSAPELVVSLADRWHEGWLASPAVADLDGDGRPEILVAREEKLLVFAPDGSIVWSADLPGRVWASPVVADFRDDAALEVAVASRDTIWMFDAAGETLSGFPVTWEDEIRSLAAGDVDGDGQLDLVAAPAHSGVTDVMAAWHAGGAMVAGFPPNAAGKSGCDDKCYIAGCYDQNVALGDLDGDGTQDIVVPHDNAYMSIHKGSGEAFDANAMFKPKKTSGVRYLHDLDLSIQGYADDEESALQAHFTNTAPAIADLDGDGTNDVVMLGSVQNAAQSDRFKGVGLWAVHADASRLDAWQEPFHAPDYIAGLWDPGGNIVGITNQVTVADLDPNRAGPELVFVGFDGRIHAVAADRSALWEVTYTTSDQVFSPGVAVADLSGDGVPEIVFATYATQENVSFMRILDAGGNTLHEVALPHRGSMAVPTIADADGDGSLDIVVSLKDAEDKVELAQIYRVESAATNCVLWGTGRGNLLRNGWVPSAK